MIFCPLRLIILLVCSLIFFSSPPSIYCLVLTPNEKMIIKKGLLQKLGLTEKPIQSAPVLPIPDHMWQFYRDVVDEENDSDWIRHYYPTKIIEENSGLLMSYNLSLSVQHENQLEAIRKAELKIKLQSNNQQQTSRHVNLFVLTKNGAKHRLLDSRPIEPSSGTDNSEQVRYMDLDLTDVLSTSTPSTLDLLLELPPETFLYSTPSHSISSIPYSKTQSAALVIQSELRDPSRVRRKRTARNGRRKGRKQHRVAMESGLCQKRELYVDFEELNWQDWILAPKGYEAGQCVGNCPSPMPSHLNATNHAIIQALIHSLNPQVPPPSCVPTETKPLSILYMDVENRIVIKTYQGMRVEACGCG
ncbi:unnamed protein product [Auanema sp. JU1783]|nr:unnamed protein product [Auanema sp. JU1783]